jgi:hypothetical protein
MENLRSYLERKKSVKKKHFPLQTVTILFIFFASAITWTSSEGRPAHRGRSPGSSYPGTWCPLPQPWTGWLREVPRCSLPGSCLRRNAGTPG